MRVCNTELQTACANYYTMDGVINVYKPAGWTSQDVCAKLRSRLHIKKIGHTGTLDPMATGVLPVCIGKATRIIEYYDRDRKAYHATMKLGITTDTLDITGETLKTNDWSGVSEDAVMEAFRAYTGVIAQVPPKYSALKINGKRAYELAREGRDFELQAREIEIYGNRVTRLALGAGDIEFDVECSKGTYIRSMIADIGRSLGCGAVMTALERTASGCFKAEDAISIDELVSIIDAACNNKEKRSHGLNEDKSHSSNNESAKPFYKDTDRNSDGETAQSLKAETVYDKGNKVQFPTDNTVQISNEVSVQESTHPLSRAVRTLNADTAQYSSDDSRVAALEKLNAILLPADETLTNLGKVLLNDNRVTAFLNGNSSYLTGCRITEESHFDEVFRVYGDGRFLGIGAIIDNELVPHKVFR